MAAVVNNVEKDLLDLVRIDHGFGQTRIQLSGDLDIARAHLILKELDRAFDQLVNTRELSLGLMASRETEQALNDLLATKSAFVNHVQVTLMLRILIGGFEEFRKAHHRGQRIVQFMRDAGNELANTGEFLALNQLRLRVLE